MGSNKDNQHLWNQFCRLGEMIGDGLHEEEGGEWISKDYRRLSRILIPEIKEQERAVRKQKNSNIDSQMANLLKDRKCNCGGELKQSRSGSKTVYCLSCKAKYVARTKKK